MFTGLQIGGVRYILCFKNPPPPAPEIGVLRHDLGPFEGLIHVLGDDVGLVQHIVAMLQYGNLRW